MMFSHMLYPLEFRLKWNLMRTLLFSFFFPFSLGYRPFMMMLQPQVNLLDKFVIQQESIPMMPPLGARQPQMQFNRGGDGMTNLSKNVSKFQSMPSQVYFKGSISTVLFFML